MNENRLLLPLFVLILVALAFGAGFLFSYQSAPPDLPEGFDALWETWTYLQRDYVDKSALDADTLAQGAIEGMLEALDDPYTSYLDAETYELDQASFEGSFEGVGAVVTMDDGQLTVVSPIAGSPAEQQGLEAGDVILEIDGEATSDISLAEAVLRIRGPQGTTVTLLVQHQGADAPVTIEIVRAEIELDSVYLEMLPGDIAYIHITYFSERTAGEAQSAISQAIDEGATALILDVRNNPGGLLSAVVEVASHFLDGGPVLYEQHGDGRVQTWSARRGGLATDISMAVLVNEASASGSEVLAGALQDRGRAVLVGTTTYGKGSVNVVDKLSDGSAVYVTTARWLTPSMRLIEGEGLTPDFTVELTDEDWASGTDTQLEFAIDYLESL